MIDPDGPFGINTQMRQQKENLRRKHASEFAGSIGWAMPSNGDRQAYNYGRALYGHNHPKPDFSSFYKSSNSSNSSSSTKSPEEILSDEVDALIKKFTPHARMVRFYVDQTNGYNETKAIVHKLYPDHGKSWNRQTLSDFILDELYNGGLHKKLFGTSESNRDDFESWNNKIRKFARQANREKRWKTVISHHDKLREKFQRYNDSGALKAFLDTGDNLQNARVIFDKLFSPKGQRGNRIMKMNSDQMIVAMGKSFRRNRVAYELFYTDQATRNLFTKFSSDLFTSCRKYHRKIAIGHLRDAISILGKNIAKPFKFIGLGKKRSKPDVTSATCAFVGHEPLTLKPSLFTRLRKGIKRMVNACRLSSDDSSFNAKSNDQTNRNTKRSKYPIFKGLKIAVLSMIAIAPASTTNTPILSSSSESDQGTNVAPQAKPTMADDTASFTHYVATQNGPLNMRAGPYLSELTYSTVTDFAKFRGWSTSVPLHTAT